ncbi:MAG: SulP family inorganic anion transporter [Actinomycetia bacterium]|nr:SulP family inorganic anion transporter [Actinomycetes bacterium]
MQRHHLDPAGWFPGITRLRRQERGSVRGDIVAGLVLSALLLPQGMAYAQLAGLPAITGLYTTAITLIAYALFGPSPTLVLGPDSSLAPMIFAAVVPLAGAQGDPDLAIAHASVLAVLMGVLCLVAGTTGLGALADLLSRPVRIGYLNGLALIILAGQLPRLFGFSTDASGFIEEVSAFARDVGSETNGPALAIGLGVLAMVLATRFLAPRLPGMLVAVLMAMAVVGWFGLDDDIAVVGELPSGFPAPSLPTVPVDDLPALVVSAFAISFVTLADTTALSRGMAGKQGDRVDPNHEIGALGAANIAAGLFQGFPVSASTSRTAVASSMGSTSQITGLAGAAVVVGVAAFSAGALADLPVAALAAIVIAASFSLFDLGTIFWLRKVHRGDFALAVAAMIGVPLLGVLPAIVLAIALSMADFVRRASRPYGAELGRIPGLKGYHDRARDPVADVIPGLLIYRFDAPLFFANAEPFRDRILELVDGSGRRVDWLILAAEPVTGIDSTAAEMLDDLIDELDERNVTLAIAELKGPARDRLRRMGLRARIGEDRLFPTLGTAIRTYLGETGTDWTDWTDQ